MKWRKNHRHFPPGLMVASLRPRSSPSLPSQSPPLVPLHPPWPNLPRHTLRITLLTALYHACRLSSGSFRLFLNFPRFQPPSSFLTLPLFSLYLSLVLSCPLGIVSPSTALRHPFAPLSSPSRHVSFVFSTLSGHLINSSFSLISCDPWRAGTLGPCWGLGSTRLLARWLRRPSGAPPSPPSSPRVDVLPGTPLPLYARRCRIALPLPTPIHPGAPACPTLQKYAARPDPRVCLRSKPGRYWSGCHLVAFHQLRSATTPALQRGGGSFRTQLPTCT